MVCSARRCAGCAGQAGERIDVRRESSRSGRRAPAAAEQARVVALIGGVRRPVSRRGDAKPRDGRIRPSWAIDPQAMLDFLRAGGARPLLVLEDHNGATRSRWV
jgi:hypothetical protein